MKIVESKRSIEVVDEVDVLVVGGGIAGVAAAVAAARQGAKVALLEKQFGLGGLATLGNVTVYLPNCDGRGRQVIGGLGDELLKLASSGVLTPNPDLGFRPIPEAWVTPATKEERAKSRLLCGFNPAVYQLQLEELLVSEGVSLYYDTRFCSCVCDAGEITHVVVENKSGRLAIAARGFVDASGDADLCAAAGERVATWDTNVLCGWYYILRDGKPHLDKYTEHFAFKEDRSGNTAPYFSGHTGRGVTDFVIESNRSYLKRIEALKAANPGEDIQPIRLPSIPSFRSTRRLNNKFALSESHVYEWLDDTVGLAGDWRKKGPVYPLPLRALQADIHANLFAAGRCISTETPVWDVTRVISVCAVTGEAAGTAAALTALVHGGDGTRLPADQVRGHLLDRGGLISPELVKESI